MTIALRNTVTNAHAFTRWIARAMTGETVTYHIGNLGADRAASPALHLLAETVAICAECRAATIAQTVMRLPAGTVTWYSSTRAAGGWFPRALMLDQIDAFEFRALQAVRDRDTDQSAPRAIRERLGCNDHLAADYLARLATKGWIAPVEKGFALTPDGNRMLA